MSKAPERIWAEPGMPGYLDEPNELYTVEYVRADLIGELEAKLTRCEKYRDAYMECDRISTQAVRELEAVLRDVDAWVDDLGMYAQEGQEPATVFKRVKEVLNK